MTSKFNKKKINLIPSHNLIKYFILVILFSFTLILIHNELRYQERFNDIVQKISEKFNYNFINYEINNLTRVEKNDILEIINKYLNKSIFLIPLDEISDSLHSLKWIKNVNLSTNLKNKIKIEIFEYKPIGLYFFNNQLFYFSEEGKIIDKYKKNSYENFTIFYGTQQLNKAVDFINIINSIADKNFSIKEAYYINDRRWDIKLNNEILINLSEKNIEESLNNYTKLIRQLSESKINLINSIDLRNYEKAIISFK